MDNKQFKLSFIGEKFSVNEKTGKVTCIMIAAFHIPSLQMLGNKEEYVKVHTFFGSAKCSSEDTFDVRKGKVIARTKAEKKAYAAFHKFNAKLMNELGDMAKALGDFQNKAERVIEHNDKFIISVDKSTPQKPAVVSDSASVKTTPTAPESKTEVKTFHTKSGVPVKVVRRTLTEKEAEERIKALEDEFEEMNKRFETFFGNFGGGLL